MADFFPEIDIRDDQAAGDRRGLYAVARADGNVHEREAAMINEFFNTTTDHASHLAALERQPKLDPAHLAAALPSADLRGLFLKSALLLAHVDGTYSPEEKKEIAAYAKACGVDATALAKLEAAVKDYLLGHLSHLHNVHGVAEVAKDLEAMTEPLEAALAAVRANLLRGEEPSAELRAFWAHQLAGEPFFLNERRFGEVTFVTEPPAMVSEYTQSADGEAWSTLFADIRWFAEEADGGLLGYFCHGATSIHDAPIVYLSNDGSPELTGMTIVDHFAWGSGGRSVLEAFCAANQLPMPRYDDDGAQSLAGRPSPDERLAELER